MSNALSAVGAGSGLGIISQLASYYFTDSASPTSIVDQLARIADPSTLFASALAATRGRDTLTDADMQIADASAAATDECTWHNFSRSPRDDIVCNTGTMLRSSRMLLREAHARAARCSARFNGAECILAHEVGLLVPGFYVFAAHTASVHDIDMVLMPRQIGYANNTANARRVRVHSLTKQGDHMDVRWNASVTVEYVSAAPTAVDALALRRAELVNESAFCFQLLQLALTKDCVQELAA